MSNLIERLDAVLASLTTDDPKQATAKAMVFLLENNLTLREALRDAGREGEVAPDVPAEFVNLMQQHGTDYYFAITEHVLAYAREYHRLNSPRLTQPGGEDARIDRIAVVVSKALTHHGWATGGEPDEFFIDVREAVALAIAAQAESGGG